MSESKNGNGEANKIYLGLAAVAIQQYQGSPDKARDLIKRRTEYFTGKKIPIEAARIMATGALDHTNSPDLLNPFVQFYRDAMEGVPGIDPLTAACMARDARNLPLNKHRKIAGHAEPLKASLESRMTSG